MKLNLSDAASVRAYHLGFVTVLIGLFLFVMVMTIQQLGTRRFEAGFFQKNFLIENFNRLRLKMGDRVFNNALVGKDGWMEFTGDRNLDDYQHAIKFSPAELEAAAAQIQNCYQYASERDTTFLIVVAPNKTSIYSDKLPEQIQTLSNESRIDQLNQYLKEHNIRQVLDLRPALQDARQHHDVYYRLGTHWNEYGAYIAYKTIIEALAQAHPELKPYSEKFFRFRINPEESLARGDLGVAQMIQASYLPLEQSLFSTRDLREVTKKIDFPIPRLPGTQIIPGYHTVSWIPESDLPSLLLVHDSFGVATLNELMALNFRKAYYVYRGSSSTFLTPQAIEQFSPDIILYQVVERQLDAITNDLAGCAVK